MIEEADLDGDGNIDYEEFIYVVLNKLIFLNNQFNSVSGHPRKQEEAGRKQQEKEDTDTF